VITPEMPLDEIVGKVALSATAAGIGALLARGQLGEARAQDEEAAPENYWAELFLMLAGALFVAFTVAPTEEMTLIAYMMTPWHALALVVLSLVIMHSFVYEVSFGGQHTPPGDHGFWRLFVRFSVVGYAVVFLASLYMLWSFGRLDGTVLHAALMITVVLSLPGALGAAAARLIL
jgi:putative integral membrane protein (TIGR02587 family)